jgi:hypothetical protein
VVFEAALIVDRMLWTLCWNAVVLQRRKMNASSSSLLLLLWPRLLRLHFHVEFERDDGR